MNSEEEELRRLLDGLISFQISKFDFEKLWNAPLPTPTVLIAEPSMTYVLIPVPRPFRYEPNPDPTEPATLETVEVRRLTDRAHSIAVSIRGKRVAVTFPPHPRLLDDRG